MGASVESVNDAMGDEARSLARTFRGSVRRVGSGVYDAADIPSSNDLEGGDDE